MKRVSSARHRHWLFRCARTLYLKLIRIHDSPHEVAKAFAAGALLGVLPGVGPAATVAVSLTLKLNLAAAMAGCLIFNPVATVFYSSGGGVVLIRGTNELWALSPWSWSGFWSVVHRTVNDSFGPFMIGYAVFTVASVLISYLVVRKLVSLHKNRKRARRHHP